MFQFEFHKINIYYLLIIFSLIPSSGFALQLGYDSGNCAEGNKCIRSGMIGSNDEVWKSSDAYFENWNDYNYFNEFDNPKKFNDSNWFEAGFFTETGHGNLVKPNQFIKNTKAAFMWHDPDGKPDGLTGPNEAYFRYVFELNADRGASDALATINVDDDYEFYFNGHLIEKNEDNGHADLVQEKISFYKYLNPIGMNVIAIHAVDGGWADPRDRLYERVLFDAVIFDITEPPLTALIIFGFVLLLTQKRLRKNDKVLIPCRGTSVLEG